MLYGVYFVWFWSRRGQTLAMQTWRIRLVTDGRRAGSPGARAGALRRLLLAWFVPATLVASALHWPPARSLGAVAAGIAATRCSRCSSRDRQFWHDRLCGTRLRRRRAARRRCDAR